MSERVLPMFCKSFIVSGCTFRSLIHFEFIFVYAVGNCSNFIFSPMELFSFPSTAYRRDYLFPIVYSCLLCLRLGDQGVSGWYTDIWNYDIFINPFIERNHRNPKWEKFYHSEGVHTFRIYDRPVATESSLLHLPHHLYHQSFREHHPDFSGLILGSTHPCISSLEVCHSWISDMLLSMPPKSWWPESLTTSASLLLAA